MDPVSIVFMVVSMAMSMMQAQQQQRAQRKAAQQALDQQAKEQWKAYEKAEKQRKDQLKKALAQRRARMGAAGFSSTDGSAGAIIQGLRTDAAEASFDDFTQKKESIDSTASSIQANLLEKSDATKRGLYSQMGSTLGSIGGSMLNGIDQKKTEIDYTKEQPGQLYEF